MEKIKLKVGYKKVILGLSGGTDSLVCELIIKTAIKKINLHFCKHWLVA
ncbi:hypothetical protein [Borreliella lusitaniae]|nr:hypothetical protein [Borreliella lusitaniae]WKC84870.1 hypothetical protein QIA24_00225 [Borreliella lusitaniae]